MPFVSTSARVLAVRLSVNIPNFGDLPDRIGLGRMAREAEAAGADGVWLADHLLLVDDVMRGYPYTDDGVFPAPSTFPFYESLASCAYLAAATERCRIGIGVLVLPQRNVIEVAKAAATVDRLSGGRFALGVGSGWNRLEMEALGYSFATRGARTDDMLRVLRTCWNGTPDAHDGQSVSIRDRVMLFPTPAQPGGIPLLVGGMADVSLKRAATLGDGWVAIAAVERLDVEALRERIERVRALRAEHGDAPFELVLKLEAEPEWASELPGALAQAAALGFDEIVIDVPWSDGVDRAVETFEACRAAIRRTV
jgi:probable F420-dependent oxidoreductase